MALKFLNDGYFAGKVGIGTESPVSIVDVSSTAPTLTIGGVALNQFESGRIRFTEFASSSGFQGSYMHYDGSTNKSEIDKNFLISLLKPTFIIESKLFIKDLVSISILFKLSS